jgi:hypothetical protein
MTILGEAMRSTNKGTRRLHLITGLLTLILLTVLPLTALAQTAKVTPGDQDDLRRRLMQHRQAEADSKTRALERMLRVQQAQTANQAKYDVHYYDLNLTLTPNTTTLSGQVTVKAEVTGVAISTMDLDLHSVMSVSAVTAGGSPAGYSHVGNLLTVTLDRGYVVGEMVEVVVSYSGNPESAGGSFDWTLHGGQTMIWTLSEPYGAREWWPCKDVNTDKADSLDIRVTVPDNLTVASNGVLVSNIDNGSTRTFHWQTSYPINTYLVSLAIHPYTFWNDWYTPQGGGAPMEVQFYVFADRFAQSQANYLLTVDMIDAFAQGWGEYPFVDEKYGHADFTWGGGMEHQTITSMGGWSEDLVSHELAHQWWGDHITCADFGHIWLNEGFATWGEAYWKEVNDGFEVYKSYMEAAGYYGPGTIFVEDPTDIGSIFPPSTTYNKASWVVHMVRGILGDTDFFAGLAAYRAQYGYGSATTEQFRDVMEGVSGKDLDTFFNQWIYGEYYPVYDYIWSQIGGTLDLTIDQIQTNTGLFAMPIQLQVVTSTDTLDFTVDNSQATENYQLAVTGQVESVLLDPDRWILRRIKSEVTDPTFHRGILVVNGVHWDTYGFEITSAYDDSTFWGDFDFSFWDTFQEPPSGYPSILPEPLGHGSVPPDLIGQFSTVVWVGNDYNGDLASWYDTPIQSYLEVGGNVMLMTRQSRDFCDTDLTNYLGVSWAEENAPLGNYDAAYPGLVDIPFLGAQSWNDVFNVTVGPQGTLLFRDTAGFPVNRGTGVHSQPPGGGSERPEGGRFVLLAGRPYRMNHDALRSNVEFILENLFSEPWIVIDVPEVVSVERLQLLPSYPNPFGSQTVIPFTLPQAGPVKLAVYDAAGRLIRTLVSGQRTAGRQHVTWDGRDGAGRVLASGAYFLRLEAAGATRVRTVVLAK